MKSYCHISFLIVLLVVTTGFILFSCHKDEEPDNADIDIQSPYVNQNFIVGDSIHVKAHISCDELITSVSIRLIDVNQTPALPVKSVYPDAHDYDLDVYYNIYGKELESGKYYLIIEVHYANTSCKKSREIYIHELPLKLEDLLVLTNSNVNTTSLQKLDANLAPAQVHDFPCDYGFAAVNGVKDRLYLAGAGIGKLFSYDLIDNTVEWEKSYDNNPNMPFFQDMGIRDNLVFTSTTDGTVWGFSAEGDIDYIALTTLPEFPGKFIVGKDFLLANVRMLSGPVSYLCHFVYSGGTLMFKKQINLNVTGFWIIDDNEVILIGNDNSSNTVIAKYTSEFQVYTQLATIPGEIAKYSCATSDDNTFLIATNSNLRSWTYGNSSTNVLKNNGNIRNLKYEPLSGNICWSEGNQIFMYSWPSLQLLKTNTLNNDIEDIIFRYNK